jgi:hypothetical protein
MKILQGAFSFARLEDCSVGILHGEVDADYGFRFYAHGVEER